MQHFGMEGEKRKSTEALQHTIISNTHSRKGGRKHVTDGLHQKLLTIKYVN